MKVAGTARVGPVKQGRSGRELGSTQTYFFTFFATGKGTLNPAGRTGASKLDPSAVCPRRPRSPRRRFRFWESRRNGVEREES